MAKKKAIYIINNCAFFFFIVLVFFLPISNAAIESSFGFIYLCLILRIIFERPSFASIKSFFKQKINLSLLVFYIAIGFSMLASGPLFKKSFNAWFFKWGEGFLLFYFGQIFLNKKRVRILSYVFVVSSLLVCLEGISQRIVGSGFIRNFELIRGFTNSGGSFLASVGTFQHYNDFAAYLTVSFFIIAGLFIYSKRFWLRLSLFSLAGLVVFNLFFTYSRGAWLSFIAVSLLSVNLFLKRNRKRVAFALLLFLFLGALSFPDIGKRFLSIFKAGADADRFRMWRIAISMFKDSPIIGKGIGLCMDYFPKYAAIIPEYVHNCYLQILAETGAIGLLSFLWFLKVLLWESYKKISENRDFVFVGIFLAVLVFLTHAFFDTQFYSLKLSTMFWVLASFLAVYAAGDSQPETTGLF